MQYIPGSSVTLSASLSYLAKNIAPDDSDVQTRIPQICVDYLSHDWLEEDVWKSWRNMTRHKNEVANGVRLENASWRTWWKQRNKLKTVSPETLNWLKDSDVTWLYGPLHTAAEPVPKPKQSTYVDRYNLEKASGKKPILKHRTITEILNLPPGEQTSIISPPPTAGSPSLEAASLDYVQGRAESPRPTLPHARSDSIITRRGVTVPVEGLQDTALQRVNSISSPPRSGSPATQSDRLSIHGGDSHLQLSPGGNNAKRHISFNTFVEQYISIEDPSKVNENPVTGSTSGSDDEDVSSSTSSILEMRPASAARPTERSDGPLLRSNSMSQEREHITIAPIPPTLLKASEDLPAPSPAVVYAPPQGFDWDITGGSDSSSSSSGDNISSSSGGSVISADMANFVPPSWSRPPVGVGSTGPVGPSASTGGDVYSAVGYGEQQRKYHQALHDAVAAEGSPPGVPGMYAGRSKWVTSEVLKEAEEEEEEEAGEDTGDESEEAGASSDAEMDEEAEPPAAAPASVVSSSTASSSTTSTPRTVIPIGSPPVSTSVRSRSSSAPSKGILKNAKPTSSSVGAGSVGSANDSSPAIHPVLPIGIPKTSVSHPQPPPPSTGGPPPSYFHMPPTATMSSPPVTHQSRVLSPSSSSSAGFLSPSQSDSLFSGSIQPASASGSTGRGRTTTRSVSSSGVSDRSRSSSKISGASSPLGSVSPSPSGYGSPSGSRASSVLGNGRSKRNSTDVGVAGRSVAVAIGPVGRNGMGVANARQSSTSPPTISSPLANGASLVAGLGSLPTSNLGTIVANVPLETGGPVQQESRSGPPLSRSGISWSKSASGSNSRIGRTGSGSSLSSSGSSGSIGTTAATAKPPSTPTAAQVAAAAPATGAASLPLPVRKTSFSALLPNGGERPTVIISPKPVAGSGQDNSNASSEVPSPSGGHSIDTREAKLDEEMRKVKAQQTLGATPPGEVSTNPTPSNSPVASATKPLAPAHAHAPPTPTKTPPPPPPKVTTSPKAKAAPSTAVVTPSSATANSTALVDGTAVGRTADGIVSSAKGLLGAIWGSGDVAK